MKERYYPGMVIVSEKLHKKMKEGDFVPPITRLDPKTGRIIVWSPRSEPQWEKEWREFEEREMGRE